MSHVRGVILIRPPAEQPPGVPVDPGHLQIQPALGEPLQQGGLHLTAQLLREFVLQGPDYKRPKPCGEERLSLWYNKKSLSIGHEEGLAEVIYTPALADRLTEGFAFLRDAMDTPPMPTKWARFPGRR